MISIILMEPEHSGNVGAIARVMKNFGFTKLVLVNPKCKIDNDAIIRSKHAKDVLLKAKILKNIPKQDYLVATTAKLGTDYNLLRTPLTPEQLASKVENIDSKIGILIGREGYGLFNKEIAKCDFLVTIPADKEYPTLNISHSVGILCYELHKVLGKRKSNAKFRPIGDLNKKQLMKLFTQVFNKLKWKTKEKKQTQKLLWKKIIGKAMLSKRESFAVMGFLRKLL